MLIAATFRLVAQRRAFFSMPIEIVRDFLGRPRVKSALFLAIEIGDSFAGFRFSGIDLSDRA